MGFFNTVLRLCLGFASYRDVRDLPVSASLIYLLKLILLLTALVSASFLPDAIRFSNTITDWTERNLPPFSIRDGVVVATVPQPYRAGDEEFLFLLDTTGKTTAADPQARYGILLTADTLTFWMKANDRADAPAYSQRRALRDIPDTLINSAYIRHLTQTFLLVIVLLLPVAAFCGTLSQALFFSFATSMLERGLPSGLRWSQLFSIAVHAVTPAAIILAAYLIMGMHDFNLQLIYLIAYGVFLLGGTNASRNTIPKQEAPDIDFP